MTTSHTKTPWSIEGCTVYKLNTSGINIFDAEVRAGYGDDDHRTRENVLEANAAFIVRACNSHEKLVAAIKKVARILDAQDDPRYSIHHPLVKPLLEALAIAEGEA